MTSQPHESTTATPNSKPLIYEGRRQDCAMTSSSGQIWIPMFFDYTDQGRAGGVGFGHNLRITANKLHSQPGSSNQKGLS